MKTDAKSSELPLEINSAPDNEWSHWRTHSAAIDEVDRCYAMRTMWEQALLCAIVDIHRLGTHEEMGFSSVADWLTGHLGLGYMRTCELVEVALALPGLPAINRAYQDSALSIDHLRALVKVANDENESDLLEATKGLTVSDTFKLVNKIVAVSKEDSVLSRKERHLQMRWDHHRRVLMLYAEIPEEQGVIVERAIDAVAAKMPEDPLYEDGPTPKGAKRVDALVELVSGSRAEAGSSAKTEIVLHLDAKVLDGGVPVGAAATKASEQRGASKVPGEGGSAERGAPKVPGEGSSAERGAPKVPGEGGSAETSSNVSDEHGARDGTGAHRDGNKIVDVDVRSWDFSLGPAEIAGGPTVCHETVARLACDGLLRVVFHDDDDGRPVAETRGRRAIPRRIRRELLARDATCRVAGCRKRKLLDNHHIRWVSRDGKESYENLVRLCERHHYMVHEGGYTIVGSPPCITLVKSDRPPLRAGPPFITEGSRKSFRYQFETTRGP
ncbi:MAG: hypothetical protein ABR507_07295 [Actinomycetota bacterium]